MIGLGATGRGPTAEEPSGEERAEVIESYDDITGEALDGKLVAQAREENNFVHARLGRCVSERDLEPSLLV